MFLATLLFSATPTPSEVIQVKVGTNGWGGNIRIRATKPPGSILFGDEEEILASITTGNRKVEYLCSIQMTTVTTRNYNEKPYKTDWGCEDRIDESSSQYSNLDGDPPLEF